MNEWICLVGDFFKLQAGFHHLQHRPKKGVEALPVFDLLRLLMLVADLRCVQQEVDLVRKLFKYMLFLIFFDFDDDGNVVDLNEKVQICSLFGIALDAKLRTLQAAWGKSYADNTVEIFSIFSCQALLMLI